MADIRRILLDGYPTVMLREHDTLVARDGRTVGVDDAVHLSPVEPTKIICCHLNHISRVQEFGVSLPPAPTYFHKPVSALNAHRAAVVRPSNCKWLNYEGEVAIVIGRTCRNVSHGEAGDYIGGYTVANDYGLHDFRDTDSGSMLRVKGADTLCPLGPGLITDWDFHGKRIRTLVNGEVRQDGSTDEMAWDMHYLVADIARLITLVPGDVILSGTPAISRSGVSRRRGHGGGGRPRLAHQPHRRRTGTGQRRGGCATHRDRGGAEHGDGWRLATARPAAAEQHRSQRTAVPARASEAARGIPVSHGQSLEPIPS